jgi:hypothetical protein
MEVVEDNQTDITQVLIYTDGDASDGIELQVDRNRPSEWLVADSNKFYGLVWSAAVDTPKTLAATEWEKVWYDIDTTNIDTSEIGEWFTTGISASISDANMGNIAESVWVRKIRADTTDGAVADTNAADHLYSASTGSGAGIGDSTIARIDSILTSLGYDDGAPTDLKSVQEKFGLEYLVSDPTLYSAIYKIDSLLNSTGRYSDTSITG